MPWEFDPENPTGGGAIPEGDPPPGGWEIVGDGSPPPEPGAWSFDPDDPTNGGTILEGAPPLGGWEEEYTPPGSTSPSVPPFTYLLDTPVGQLRLLVSDNDPETYLFLDVELQFFLTRNGNDLSLAGAEVYETWARDRVRLEKSWKNAEGGGTYYDAQELLAMADRLRRMTRVSGARVGELIHQGVPPRDRGSRLPRSPLCGRAGWPFGRDL